MEILESLFTFVKNYVPILISIFTLFLVIKRDNRSNPNILIHSLRFTSAMSNYSNVWTDSLESQSVPNLNDKSKLVSLTLDIQNVGNLPVNWGFVYLIDFTNKQIVCSRPLYYIDVKEKYTVKLSMNPDKKTDQTILDKIFWKYSKNIFSFFGFLQSGHDYNNTEYVTLIVFSDFTNSKYMLIKGKHDLNAFTKTQVNLNIFHPILWRLFKYIRKKAIFQKNTFEDRKNLLGNKIGNNTPGDPDEYLDRAFKVKEE